MSAFRWRSSSGVTSGIAGAKPSLFGSLSARSALTVAKYVRAESASLEEAAPDFHAPSASCAASRNAMPRRTDTRLSDPSKHLSAYSAHA